MAQEMYKRIVIKLGTSVLTSGSRHLNRSSMLELVRQCAQLHEQGHELIICSSGAIAAGREKLEFPELGETLAERQMLAAVGQSRLMYIWESLFDIYNIRLGQLLLTRADVQDRQRFLNAQDALQELVKHRIIPIINENDAVATAEIKVGDNDNLSALASVLAQTELLILLTDQPGLFTADPRTDPGAQLIPEVKTIDQTLKSLAGGSVSGLGIGGMATKLQAADIARRAGADVVIAAGSAPDVIRRIVHGEAVGTRFPALQTPLEQRKRWIFASSTPEGVLTVNSEAVASVCGSKKSLTPENVVGVNGNFKRGDTVLIRREDGFEIGQGIVRYDRSEMDRIKGCSSDQIDDILGYGSGPAVHMNDLILLVEDEKSWK